MMFLLFLVFPSNASRCAKRSLSDLNGDEALTVKAEYVKECIVDSTTDSYDETWYHDAVHGDDAWITALMQMSRDECVPLRQEHFQLPNTPITIEETGRPQCFVLTEDVVVDFGRVDKLNSSVPLHHGFPFALRILANNVLIDLQGHSMKMSRSYFNRSPFTSLIDLAEFPLDGKSLYPVIKKWANRTIIHNGTLGLTAHFGVHGNYNKGLVLSHLRVENFFVGGVQINGARDVSVEHVVVDNTQFKAETDVSFGFVLEMARRAQFFAQDKSNGYVNACPSTGDEYGEVRALIGAEIESILADPEFEQLLDDPSKYMPAKDDAPAGNVYGFYFASKHNVQNFATDSGNTSANIRMVDVVVRNVAKSNEEGRTLVYDDDQDVVLKWKDIFGHRGDYDMLCDENGNFRPADFKMKLAIARILLTECAASEEDYKGVHAKKQAQSFFSSVMPILLQGGFVEGTSCDRVGSGRFRPMSGLDTSGHASKGLVGIRMDQIDNLLLESVVVEGLHDKADFGIKSSVKMAYIDQPPVWKTKEHTKCVYKGNFVYGITIGGSSRVKIHDAQIQTLKSNTGTAMGLALMGSNQRVQLSNVVVSDLRAGIEVSDRENVPTPNMVPEEVPYFLDRTNNASDVHFNHVLPSTVYAFASDCEDESCCSGEKKCNSSWTPTVRGCMQERAANYDKHANEDVGCVYHRTNSEACEEKSNAGISGAVCMKRHRDVELHYGLDVENNVVTLGVLTTKKTRDYSLGFGIGRKLMNEGKAVIASGDGKLTQRVVQLQTSASGMIMSDLNDFASEITHVLQPDSRQVSFKIDAKNLVGSLEESHFIYSLENCAIKGDFTVDLASSLRLHCDSFTCSTRSIENARDVACIGKCTASVCCEDGAENLTSHSSVCGFPLLIAVFIYLLN